MTSEVISPLPGIDGTLFPGQYLADAFDEAIARAGGDNLERQWRRFRGWWDRVEATCGPATGIRALFDLAAMPLAGLLGFRARHAQFDRSSAAVRLETPGATTVGMMVRPWAARPSTAWRDVTALAREFNVRWTFVVAPPFLSVVPSQAGGIRRSVDFRFPDVLDVRSFARFHAICRASSLEATSDDATCPLDALTAAGVTFQDRVRTDLQDGVVRALAALGPALDRRASRTPEAGFNEALTLVYRVLFLLFAESRNLVPSRHPVYGPAYSIGALCRRVLAGDRPTGLWEGLAAITRLSRAGCHTDDLIVRPFNGRLFARAAAPSLEAHRLTRLPTPASKSRDTALGLTLLSLASRQGRGGREEIAYADLGVEQLGAVYERVLDLDPDLPVDREQSVRRRPAHHSRRRKESGTFYTPQPLAEFVVRRTLAPLVEGVTPDRILSLRVVDPAMGSGAFLVAACRYLSGAYERALVDEGQAAPGDFDDDQRAAVRRLIAERCLAGVDANPIAVQLARLSLWLATLARGKPLGFLDHRLRTGNSLLGASPDDLARTGRRTTSGFKPDSQLPLLDHAEFEHDMRQVSRPLVELMHRRDETVRDVRAKEAVWNRLSGSQSPLERWRTACTLWCARWFWPSGSGPTPPEMRAALDALLKRDTTLAAGQLAAWIRIAGDAGARHRFFHWPLEFADVFYDESGCPRTTAGFDAVIGNPPWEMLRRDGSARGDAGAESTVKFIRESGLYPSCGHGHLNLYQPFLERALSLAHNGGRIGLILPWGLAADDGAKELREKLLDRSRVDTIVGVDNANGIFPVHRGLRFLVVIASPNGITGTIRARFGVSTLAEIDELPGREDTLAPTAYPVRLTSTVLANVGGIGRRIPDIRDLKQLGFLEQLMDRFPALGSTRGWSAEFGRELNATEDRACFGTSGLPVLEGKDITPFVADTRAAANRIDHGVARKRLPGCAFERARLAYRDVSSVSNRVSLIAAVVPARVVTTHTLFCLRTPLPLARQHFLCALFNSFVLNAIVRMLMGGHLTTSLVESLPVPVWSGDPLQRRIAALACRLARRSDNAAGHAELQASIARLCAIDSQTFRAVLETFPLISRQERDRALQSFMNLD
jgi:Eco57I restriction-modification methylase